MGFLSTKKNGNFYRNNFVELFFWSLWWLIPFLFSTTVVDFSPLSLHVVSPSCLPAHPLVFEQKYWFISWCHWRVKWDFYITQEQGIGYINWYPDLSISLAHVLLIRLSCYPRINMALKVTRTKEVLDLLLSHVSLCLPLPPTVSWIIVFSLLLNFKYKVW